MERLFFLKKFIDAPQQIGSITPSSKFLVQKMLGGLDWKYFRYVAELGTGTGVFTRYIMQHKHSQCKFLGIERDAEMRQNLQAEYPDAFWDECAENLCDSLRMAHFPRLDCVVSGLPFAVLEESARFKIMEGVLRAMAPDGIFVAFQYSLQMNPLLRRYFGAVSVEFTMLNLPPAFIYFCRRNS